MIPPHDGILLIDKEEGETSTEVVRKIKRLLNVRKAGHAGTLDPFATGLLPILIGQGTKLSRFVMSEHKVYDATIRLGIQTDTHDPTGKVIREHPLAELTRESINEQAREFIGEIDQIPPAFSAVRYSGVRAYKLARKGIQFTLSPKKVQIFSIDIFSVDLPDIALRVACSAGTYIRVLASDLAAALGCLGHLRSLRRIACGGFRIENSIKLENFSTPEKRMEIVSNLIPLRTSLPGMVGVEVSEQIQKRVKQGYQPTWQDLGMNPPKHRNDIDNFYIKLTRRTELVAVAKAIKGEGAAYDRIELERVFC